MNRPGRILLLLFIHLMFSHAARAVGGETAFPLAGIPGGKQRSKCWKAQDEAAVFLCVHGIQTHAEWFAPLAQELLGHGITSYALDDVIAPTMSLLLLQYAGANIPVQHQQFSIDSSSRLGASR